MGIRKTLIGLGSCLALSLILIHASGVGQSQSASTVPVAAGVALNDYGCVGSCTAEYEIRHVKAILAANPDLIGTKDIRITCKVSRTFWGTEYFQDINDEVDVSKWSSSKITQDFVDAHFLALDGFQTGLSFKRDDVVGIVGTLKWEKLGSKRYKVLTLYRPTVYRVNDHINLGLLPPAQYLG